MIPLTPVPRDAKRSAPPFPTDIGRMERRAYREELLLRWAKQAITRDEMIEGIVRLKHARTHRRPIVRKHHA